MFEQNRVLLRLQQRVLAEKDILVCFLGGSYGRGTQDPYSDIDVVLVFADDASREAAYRDRREFVRSVLPYVPACSFDAAHVRPYLHVALYSNGAKIDYHFETKESLEPGPREREIRILKDSNGWGERLQLAARESAAGQRPQAITSAELAALDERFWIMFMDVYRQVLRGDCDRPYLTYLELLSFTLPVMLGLLPSEDTARQGLIGTAYQRDPRATAEHLRDLSKAYRVARQAIVQRHQLLYEPNDAFERELQRKISG